MIKIAPSILAADFADMKASIKLAERAGADYIHCDVMDGMFVPNISFGFPMIEAVKKLTRLPLDVHLMIEGPERYVERFAEAGADLITVHQEACPHLQRVLSQIRACGKKAGAVLNPATPPETLEYVMEDMDIILLMSVNPGYGGQKFIPAVLKKIEKMRQMITASGRSIELEVDGGVNAQTAADVVKAGADVLVAGSAVFESSDPARVIAELRGSGK